MPLDFKALGQQITELCVTHGLQLLIALATLWIGWKLCNLVIKGLKRWFDKADYDEALESFIYSLVSIGLKAILLVTCAGIAGLPTTSLVAVLGTAGLAIGMALSGTLQNFAGGVLILILKPFKVGDVIESQGQTGKVQGIQIFNTIINTGDNKRVILPNGPVATSTLINYSAEKKRRVELLIGIGYDDDIDQAKQLILELASKDDRIDQDPAPMVVVKELGDNSVNLMVRVWGDSSDFWGISFDLTESIKKSFDQASISFPYPQTDVHLHNVG